MSTDGCSLHPRVRHLWRLLLPLTLMGGSGAAQAHDLLSEFIQHRVRLSVSERHVDVSLELTFFEDWSMRERRVIDANGNGQIRRSEIESYLRVQSNALLQGVKLRVADQVVELAPLYEPELDLLGYDGTGRAHHRLILVLFAGVPAALKPGTKCVIEDRLWPEARAIGLLDVESQNGWQLQAGNQSDGLFPALRPKEARQFKVRCLKPPGSSKVAPSSVSSVPPNKS